MGADLSRVRFDARNDYAGVVLQQGRLLLDADWNELVAILDRKLRAASPTSTPRARRPGSPGWRWCRGRPPTRSRSPSRRRADASAGAGCTSTGSSPRTTASAPTRSSRCSPRRRAPPTRRTSSSPTGPTPTRCRRPAASWPTWTCGTARSPTSRHRTWSSRRSASTPPHAGRPRGRCGSTPSAGRRSPAPPPTPTSPAGRPSSRRPEPG